MHFRSCLQSFLLRSAVYSLAFVGLSTAAHAGTNLLANPGAEAGQPFQPVPGWILTGAFEVVDYGDPASSGFPGLDAPSSPTKGKNFFSGGQANSFSAASQQVSLSFSAATIDAGVQKFTLSGWLGGWSSQDDHAVVSVDFRDQLNVSIGNSISIGPVLASNRGNVTSFLFRSITTTIPKLARSAVVTIGMTRTDGSYNDGYADDISFSLENTCPADLNGDGVVEDADFSIFAVAYNILDCADPTMPAGCPADLNNDGVVDDSDFSIFVVAYDALLCP